MVSTLMRLLFTGDVMYYVRAIHPDKTTDITYGFVTLMEDYSIDNLIQAFIKECIKRAGGKEHLLEGFVPHEDEMVGKFFLERNKEEHIGFMVWGKSDVTNEPVLAVTRIDRNNNIYFY